MPTAYALYEVHSSIEISSVCKLLCRILETLKALGRCSPRELVICAVKKATIFNHMLMSHPERVSKF